MRESIESLLLEPFRLFTDPGERVWWPAILAGLGIAFLWELRRLGNARKAMGETLPLRALVHPSSWVDMEFVIVRAAVRTFVIGALPFGAKIVAVKTVLIAYDWMGKPPVVLSGSLLVVLYSVGLFVASDATRYALHRAFHSVPFLWRFHQVHHSAEVLTPLTLYRNHPVEQFLQALRSIFTIGVVGGLFAWLSFGKASPAELFGVPAIILAFNVLGANLRHSHNWLPYPERIERWLISPAQHQLHHGRGGAENRVNYGAFLACWDRWLGSLSISAGRRPEAFGLKKEDRVHRPDSLFSALVDPLIRIRKPPAR